MWRSLQCSPRSAAAPPRSGRWLPWRPACCASGEPAFAGVAAACSMCCRVGQLGTYRAIDRTQHGRPHSSTRMRSLAESASAPPPPCARRRPEPGAFPAAVLYCTLCSFMLGYHVHEKAILMVSVPMAVMAAAGLVPDGRRAAGDFLFLSTGEPVQSGAWAVLLSARCSAADGGVTVSQRLRSPGCSRHVLLCCSKKRPAYSDANVEVSCQHCTALPPRHPQRALTRCSRCCLSLRSTQSRYGRPAWPMPAALLPMPCSCPSTKQPAQCRGTLPCTHDPCIGANRSPPFSFLPGAAAGHLQPHRSCLAAPAAPGRRQIPWCWQTFQARRQQRQRQRSGMRQQRPAAGPLRAAVSVGHGCGGACHQLGAAAAAGRAPAVPAAHGGVALLLSGHAARLAPPGTADLVTAVLLSLRTHWRPVAADVTGAPTGTLLTLQSVRTTALFTTLSCQYHQAAKSSRVAPIQAAHADIRTSSLTSSAPPAACPHFLPSRWRRPCLACELLR